jgi:uncharacterized Zn finger protein
MAAGDYQPKHKRGEVQRRLTAIKAIADEFVAQEHYAVALTIYLAPEVALQAAERAEEIDPRASRDLYQQHIEHLIAGRGRANYRVACRYLIKIRSLSEKLDETEQWTIYIDWLRKRQSRLSTLKEELAAAGL